MAKRDNRARVEPQSQPNSRRGRTHWWLMLRSRIARLFNFAQTILVQFEFHTEICLIFERTTCSIASAGLKRASDGAVAICMGCARSRRFTCRLNGDGCSVVLFHEVVLHCTALLLGRDERPRPARDQRMDSRVSSARRVSIWSQVETGQPSEAAKWDGRTCSRDVSSLARRSVGPALLPIVAPCGQLRCRHSL
jgi:hypothetical protein